MNNKFLLISVIIILFFAVFATVVYAKSSNLFCLKKYNMIVTLKNESNVDISKNEILKISQIKITDIKYRDKEWSKMVNKMDLPNMQNPFKNEFFIKIKKNTNIDEVYDKIKDMDFVEKVHYVSATECLDK